MCIRDSTLPRGKTFGEAIEIEKAYAKQTESNPQQAEANTSGQAQQSAVTATTDPDQKLRQTLQQGLALELLSREVLAEPTTITTRYQVTNRSDVAINGLTLGVRVRDKTTGLELIQPSYCFVSHYRRLESGATADFDCETKQVAPELVQPFLQSDPRFEVSPVLRFVQLTNGRDLMFE